MNFARENPLINDNNTHTPPIANAKKPTTENP